LFLLVGALAFASKIVIDGAGRNPTRIAFYSIERAWRNGNLLGAGKGVLNTTRAAIDGGVRWQLATYMLSRSARLKVSGHMEDAVNACLDASDTFGAYDNGSDVFEECTDMFWEKEHGYYVNDGLRHP
jgi:hypothetical protein